MAVAFDEAVALSTSGTSGDLPAITADAGDWLYVWARVGSGPIVSVVSSLDGAFAATIRDNSGNSYPFADSGGGSLGLYKLNVVTTGSHVITITPTSSSTIRAVAFELSGLDATNPDDKAAYQSPIDPLASGVTATRSQDDEILIGVAFDDSGDGTPTAGTGFTIPTNGSISKVAMEYQVVSAAGTDQATFNDTWTLINGFCGILTLKAAAAGGEPDELQRKRRVNYMRVA